MEIDSILVGEAFKFMLIGMGVVFLFLTFIMYSLKLQAYLVGKFVSKNEKNIKSNEWKPVNKDNSDIVAAITAAIIHNTSNQKG